MSASATAPSVTVCSVFQLETLNTSEVPDCTTMSKSPLTRLTVTVVGLSGALSSFTWKSAVPPSGTVTAFVLVRMTGGGVLSCSVAVTSLLANPGELHRIIAEPLVRSASAAAPSVTVWFGVPVGSAEHQRGARLHD